MQTIPQPLPPRATRVPTELLLIRGLPGSGKSTLARSLSTTHLDHWEADQFFSRSGEYRFDPALLNVAHTWCLEQARASLKAGRSCVVSNTFSRQWEILPYRKLADELEISFRLITTTGQWPNIHNVPEETITRMRARWENALS